MWCRAAHAPVAAKGVAVAKTLGDPGTDVVYVPVTPCRLVDTRAPYPAVYQNEGPFTPGATRNYTVQGGNGVCLSQLPSGLNPAAVQVQVFGIPVNGVSGDIEVLPQGSTFGGSATLVFLGNNQFTSAGTTARINQANNQISVQVRLGTANVAIDVVGYFQRPTNYGGTHVITGINATDSGGVSNTASGDYSTVAGGANNTASGAYSTVSGGPGNTASGSFSTVAGGGQNTASGAWSTAVGGNTNTAGGLFSLAAGRSANAANTGCFVWADGSTSLPTSCFANNEYIAKALGGFYFYTSGTWRTPTPARDWHRARVPGPPTAIARERRTLRPWMSATCSIALSRCRSHRGTGRRRRRTSATWDPWRRTSPPRSAWAKPTR